MLDIVAQTFIVLWSILYDHLLHNLRNPLPRTVEDALRYNTTGYYLATLLHAVCDIRDGLRTAFQGRLGTKDIYVKVEHTPRQST